MILKIILKDLIIINELNVYSTWQEINPLEVKNSIAIVIDVFRASNTIITALNNGATSIIPVSELDVAWELKKKHPSYLLGGERDCLRIEGFNFGNSPLEYKKDLVKDNSIIFTTSNGSRALNKVKPAKEIYVASFANSKAIATKLNSSETDISIICAGTLGKTSLEDTLAAGKIIDDLFKTKNYKLNDFAILANMGYENFKDNLEDILINSMNGERLIKIDRREDIKYCTLVDTTTVIPIYKDDKLTL